MPKDQKDKKSEISGVEQGGLPLPEEVFKETNDAIEEIDTKMAQTDLDALKSKEPIDGGKFADNVAYSVPAGRIRRGQVFETKQVAAVAASLTREDVASMILEAESRLLAEIARLNDQLSASRVNEEGLLADMVGGIFNCPKCGLRLNSPSLTGAKGGLYEHPFQESVKLSGQQCELKGLKFKAPIVFLQYAEARFQPRPLTPVTK